MTETKHINDGDIISVEGLHFIVRYHTDYDAAPPWEDDGHGPVRSSQHAHSSRPLPEERKRSHERPLNMPCGWRETQYYYDWREACKRARADKWDAQPYGQPNRIHRAVQADFEYLQAFINGEWEYVCVEIIWVMPDGTAYPQCEDNLRHCARVPTIEDDHFTVAIEVARDYARAVKQDLLLGDDLSPEHITMQLALTQ